jgi:hypothetical protein
MHLCWGQRMTLQLHLVVVSICVHLFDVRDVCLYCVLPFPLIEPALLLLQPLAETEGPYKQNSQRVLKAKTKPLKEGMLKRGGRGKQSDRGSCRSALPAWILLASWEPISWPAHGCEEAPDSLLFCEVRVLCIFASILIVKVVVEVGMEMEVEKVRRGG